MEIRREDDIGVLRGWSVLVLLPRNNGVVLGWGFRILVNFVISINISAVFIDFCSLFRISEYLDEAMLIPKNTSVLIRRVPGRPRMPIVTDPQYYLKTFKLLFSW